MEVLKDLKSIIIILFGFIYDISWKIFWENILYSENGEYVKHENFLDVLLGKKCEAFWKMVSIVYVLSMLFVGG